MIHRYLERYIHSLMVYSPCILTSFHVYFIIFTPLSPGLMCVMVLADFTIGSFVICKRQAFGPSPCGKGTELGKLWTLLMALSMIWSKSVCTFGSTVLLSPVQGGIAGLCAVTNLESFGSQCLFHFIDHFFHFPSLKKKKIPNKKSKSKKKPHQKPAYSSCF